MWDIKEIWHENEIDGKRRPIKEKYFPIWSKLSSFNREFKHCYRKGNYKWNETQLANYYRKFWNEEQHDPIKEKREKPLT